MPIRAKNILRFEIFEKILKFTYRNLNGKLIFYEFSLPSSRSLAGCWIAGLGLCLCGRCAGLGGCLTFGGSSKGCINDCNRNWRNPWILEITFGRSSGSNNVINSLMQASYFSLRRQLWADAYIRSHMQYPFGFKKRRQRGGVWDSFPWRGRIFKHWRSIGER